ncbi:MAG: hypothetical protein QM757_29000 [Paludibaculum sp.]
MIAAGPAASFVSGSICLVLFLVCRKLALAIRLGPVRHARRAVSLIDSVANLLPIGTANGG